ncbi:hypothetical protein [Streptomyces sp. NPDC057682]|uniref:hypothetical protein n=1 Tax=Streptomyces sp. NPDC057682 TaxID=3346210 RepID=UPI0036A5B3B5
MAQIVGELVDSGMRDAWISWQLGISRDEVLRLRQIVGVQKVKGIVPARRRT